MSLNEPKEGLPKVKQTALGLYVTARDAYEEWQANPEKVMIIDVRTPEEYFFVGHPTMAWNIPVFARTSEGDAAKQQFPMRNGWKNFGCPWTYKPAHERMVLSQPNKT